MVVYGLPLDDDAGWIGGPIIGRGKFMPTYVTGLDAETGQGKRAVVHYTTGAQAVEVEVDTETGQIEIVRLAATYDVGKAINPAQVHSQIRRTPSPEWPWIPICVVTPVSRATWANRRDS